MHSRAGRRLSVSFGSETLSAQLPLLNLYAAAPAIQSISAKVSSICSKNYQLTSIRNTATDGNYVTLPSSMKMDRPRQVDQSVRRSRFLLHVAEEAGIRVSLKVRVILWQSDLTPAYLEFRGVDESPSLRRAMDLLCTEPAPLNERAGTRIEKISKEE